MRKISFILSLIAGVACSAFAQAGPDRQVIAKFSDAGVHIGNQKLKRINPRIDQELLDGALKVYRVPAGVSREDYRDALFGTGAFEFVEDNVICSPAATPNDPIFGTQWHLGMISAPQAWDFTEGSPSMIVAIIDSGVALNHPDLAGQLVSGYNTISGLTQAAGGNLSDIHSTGHGTRCMGIAVAKGNNGIGVSGVGWSLKGMPVRVSDLTTGNTPLSELIEGVEWAANNGARAVSVSYTGVAGNSVELAGQYCKARNAQLVWAAGNENTNLSTFDHKSVIIVGGTDQSDAKIAVSNYGKAVDIYAPASQIFTTNKNLGYLNAPVGTSFATPQVAAAFAMIWSANPTLSQDEVERRLFLRARDLGPVGNDDYWGNGRLNMGTSVEWPARRYKFKAELPRNGWSNMTLCDVSSNGQWAVGYVDFGGGASQLFIWGPNGTIYYEPPSFQAIMAQINNNGSLVFCGNYYYNGSYSMRWSPSGGWVTLPSTLLFGSDVFGNGINNSGYIVGAEKQGTVALRKSFAITGTGTFINLTGTMVGGGYAGRNHEATVVNDQGWKVFSDGTAHENGMYAVDGTNSEVVPLPAVGQGLEARAWAINSYGEVIGTANWNWAYNPRIGYWNIFNTSESKLLDPGEPSRGIDINDRGDILGYSFSADRHYLWKGLAVGTVDSLYDNLPSGASTRNTGWNHATPTKLTDTGDIFSTLVLSSGQRRVHILTPTDVPFAQYNLGQLGENPSYVGTIPPVVAVQFRTPENVNIGGPLELNYASQTGRTPLVLPSGLTTGFRMYLKQPGFLGRLYPPMDQPALAPDAFSTPMLELYQGDCDNDNEVGPGDFEIVVSNFGSIVGDPGVDGSADVDGDGEVGPGDFEIIVENFGLAGDL